MEHSDFLPIVLILFFSGLFFSGSLNRKLVGYHDWNSVVYSSSARSLSGKAETGEIFYQQDYPLLLPLTLALSFLLFGIKEWSVRLVPIIFTMLTSLMIYFLGKNLKGKKVGLIAAILYLNTPLLRYYGKIPIHETTVPFFALLIFYIYWRWFKKNDLKKYLLLLIAIFFGQQFGWPAYFPIPLISLHYLLFSKRKNIMLVGRWWFISFFSFAIFLLTDYLISGKFPLQNLWNIFVTRAAFNKNDPYVFTWFQFITKELLWMRVYLTRVLSLLAVVGLIKLLAFWIRKGIKAKDGLLIFLGVFGCMYLFIFRQASFLHEYVIIYLFPFFSLVAAMVLNTLTSKIKIHSIIIIFIVLFLMFVESNKFLNEIEKVNTYYPGYELGIFLNKRTKPREKVLFLSKASGKMYGIYFYFYSNRAYEISELSLNQFRENSNFYSKNYRFLVFDREDNIIDEALVAYLKKNCSFKDVSRFEVFDLKSL